MALPVRTIGDARAKARRGEAKIDLANLTCKFKRLVHHERRTGFS